MNGQGVGSQIVGGLVAGLLGVLAIAGIYQANKPNTPLVPAVSTAYNNTLGSIFK